MNIFRQVISFQAVSGTFFLIFSLLQQHVRLKLCARLSVSARRQLQSGQRRLRKRHLRARLQRRRVSAAIANSDRSTANPAHGNARAQHHLGEVSRRNRHRSWTDLTIRSRAARTQCVHREQLVSPQTIDTHLAYLFQQHRRRGRSW